MVCGSSSRPPQTAMNRRDCFPPPPGATILAVLLGRFEILFFRFLFFIFSFLNIKQRSAAIPRAGASGAGDLAAPLSW